MASAGRPAVSQAPVVGTETIGRRRGFRHDNLTGYLFIAPWLIGFFAFTLLPMVASLYFSFTEYSVLSSPRWIGLDNFVRMFTQDARYWNSVRATFTYVFTAVPLRLIFALAVAMLLNTKHRGVSLYRAAYYAPSIVGGSVAVAVMWRQIFGTEGVVNAVTQVFGIPPVTWLGDPRTAIWTLVTSLPGLPQNSAALGRTRSTRMFGSFSSSQKALLPASHNSCTRRRSSSTVAVPVTER